MPALQDEKGIQVHVVIVQILWVKEEKQLWHMQIFESQNRLT